MRSGRASAIARLMPLVEPVTSARSPDRSTCMAKPRAKEAAGDCII